ncbi:hypothetical protein [Streptomyces sp. NPDC001889]
MTTAFLVALTAGTSACGTETDREDPSAATESVKGLRDDVRHVAKKTENATRPHMVTTCTTVPKRVKHTSSSGSGKRRTTRTWYTTEQSKSCTTVEQGTETYKRTVRPERWCVELDDVNGDRNRDDVWFRVTPDTYDKTLATPEGDLVEITPSGKGC